MSALRSSHSRSLFPTKDIFAPFVHLMDSMVFNKAASASGQERAYWNIKSLQALIDTSGLGVGLGSSRASSWPIAVASQLGVVGGVMIAMLLLVVFKGMGHLGQYVDPETNAVVSSARASALASVVAGSFSSGSSDAGMIFFIAFASYLQPELAPARRERYSAGALCRLTDLRSRLDSVSSLTWLQSLVTALGVTS